MVNQVAYRVGVSLWPHSTNNPLFGTIFGLTVASPILGLSLMYIMRKRRARCHAAVRQARRNQNDIVNNRIASALAENNNRQFWSEVKRIGQAKCTVGGVVDGRCNSSDIADLFAEKYRDLYTSVPFDEADMQCIRHEFNVSLTNSDIVSSSFVSVSDVLRACGCLKVGNKKASIR